MRGPLCKSITSTRTCKDDGPVVVRRLREVCSTFAQHAAVCCCTTPCCSVPCCAYAGRVEISAQNHNFAVDPDTLPEGVEVTHINLNDGTCAGMVYPAKKAMTIQVSHQDRAKTQNIVNRTPLS